MKKVVFLFGFYFLKESRVNAASCVVEQEKCKFSRNAHLKMRKKTYFMGLNSACP